MESARKQGQTNVLASYICAANDSSIETAVIVHLNIYDESPAYAKIHGAADIPDVNDKFLDYYAKDMTANGHITHKLTYKKMQALEYTGTEAGFPTKSILFLNNKKSYLLNVSSHHNLEENYAKITAGFELL